jgi:hypothetical protein
VNEREGLNILDYLATGINKNDPVIQAIVSNFEGDGAIAHEIEELIGFIEYYTRTEDVRNHQGDSLEMITKLFTSLTRQIQENDDRLLRRMRALTERKGDTVWGNALDIQHVIETFFDTTVYVCENTGDTNMVPNGDFEEDGAWQLGGEASYQASARFSGRRGLSFAGKAGESCDQTLVLSEGVYTLHFFLKGTCGVIIRDEEGQYWDGDERTLAWTHEEVVNRFESADWDDFFCFIVLAGMAQVTVQFSAIEGVAASIDHVRVFQKPVNPSYTVIIPFQGFTIADKTLHLGGGNADPIDTVAYGKESYFDHSYITGRKGSYREEVYKSVLDMVRPRGIQAFIEFVEKAELEAT